MTLQQLRYFLAVHQHGSFRAAADALHLSQPSVSAQVRLLESELGTPLFVRLGRGLAVTEAGTALIPEARRVLAAVDQAEQSVADVRELRGGSIAFGIFGNVPAHLAGGTIASLLEAHPGVRVRLAGRHSAEVADAIRAGELEAGLIVLPIDDRGLAVEPVMQEEILYASADPERVAGPVTIERITAAPLIAYDAYWGLKDPTRRQIAARAQAAGVPLEPVIEVEEIHTAMWLAARGVGDMLVPSVFVADPQFPASLITRPLAEPLYDTFAFVHRRGEPVSAPTRVVFDIVGQHLASSRSRMGVVEHDRDAKARPIAGKEGAPWTTGGGRLG